MISDRKRIGHFFPAQLVDRLTPVGTLFETSSMGVPDVNATDWKLEITGLVDRPLSFSLAELKSLAKRTIETVFVCSGNPGKPHVPLRRAANVKWAGADLADILELAGVRPEATHVWSYGLDHGTFFGAAMPHYVKDMPLARLAQGNVMIAYELNDAPLTQINGFPARLVIPGFYGTNNVKWLCRLALMDRRPSEFKTITMYNDPDLAADPTGNATKPIWELPPESLMVWPKSKAAIARQPAKIWGWAWSGCAIRSVEVSVDGGENWIEASLEPARGLSWQRFSYVWLPAHAGPSNVRCRATDVRGRTQPAAAARNAVHSVDVTIED